jgi:hypothetical protein
MRLLLLALVLSTVGCHRWTYLVRSDGIPRRTPLTVERARISPNLAVDAKSLDEGLEFAASVGREIDGSLVEYLVHDGAKVRKDARHRLVVTIVSIEAAKGPWMPRPAALTARVELFEGEVVHDAVLTHVFDRRAPTLGDAVARDVADWVAYRQNSW